MYDTYKEMLIDIIYEIWILIIKKASQLIGEAFESTKTQTTMKIECSHFVMIFKASSTEFAM